MTIAELIAVLKIQPQDAEIFITESPMDCHPFLAYCPDSSNPDKIKEIRLQ